MDTGLKFLVAESVFEINPLKSKKYRFFGPILRKKIFERSAKIRLAVDLEEKFESPAVRLRGSI